MTSNLQDKTINLITELENFATTRKLTYITGADLITEFIKEFEIVLTSALEVHIENSTIEVAYYLFCESNISKNTINLITDHINSQLDKSKFKFELRETNSTDNLKLISLKYTYIV